MSTIAVDIGGTFTDFVRIDEQGNVVQFKLLTDVRAPERTVIEGVRKAGAVRELLHASTIATNALRGQVRLDVPIVGMVVTRGFRDVIEIGRQNRPKLYDLFFEKPRPLVPRELRVEVDERVDARGGVQKEVSVVDVRRAAEVFKRKGVVAVAVTFLNSSANPHNEEVAKRVLSEEFEFVVASHEVAPEPREYERFSTAVVNALLMPIVSTYVSRLVEGLGDGCEVYVMSSAGGLVDTDEARRRPIHMIESGPAAGVVAACEFAKLIGEPKVISFDVGGTTAKAGSVVNYEIELTGEYEVGGEAHHGRIVKGSGYPVRSTFIDLAEVSAGGGTMIELDEFGALKVGPMGAGADPGPICYGRGGKVPTVTDANLLLGLLPDRLLGGEMLLLKAPVEEAFRRMGDPYGVSREALRIAHLEAARSIRLVTVERGLDPSEFALFAFGGAGPQFAPFVAEELGIRKVVVPPHPGVFSALGLLMADWRLEARASFPTDLEGTFRSLEEGLAGKLGKVDFFVRWPTSGTGDRDGSSPSSAQACTVEDVRVAFEEKHQTVYGVKLDREIEVVTVRAMAVSVRRKPVLPEAPASGSTEPSSVRRTLMRDEWVDTPVYRRDRLPRGFRAEGPALIDEYNSTTVVPDGWTLSVGPKASLILERS
jgi:N-methylhydantoinase A/acetone carboxylase, beta subunit